MRICEILLSRVTKASKYSKIMAPTMKKPSWKNPHSVLENYILYYGTGMRYNCTEFQKKYLAHIGDKMSFEDAIAQECDHDGHLFNIDSNIILHIIMHEKVIANLSKYYWIINLPVM